MSHANVKVITYGEGTGRLRNKREGQFVHPQNDRVYMKEWFYTSLPFYNTV